MSEVPKHQSSVPDPNTIANASANFNLNAGGAGTGAGGTAAQVSEYETGVSNGDVDWLFRGSQRSLPKR